MNNCDHAGFIEVYSEWMSGECLRLDVQCTKCGLKGSIMVVLDPKNILWKF